MRHSMFLKVPRPVLCGILALTLATACRKGEERSAEKALQ